MALGLAQGRNLILRFHVAAPSEIDDAAESRKGASFAEAVRRGSREVSVAKSGPSEDNGGESRSVNSFKFPTLGEVATLKNSVRFPSAVLDGVFGERGSGVRFSGAEDISILRVFQN